jgi:hypothetical protein
VGWDNFIPNPLCQQPLLILRAFIYDFGARKGVRQDATFSLFRASVQWTAPGVPLVENAMQQGIHDYYLEGYRS